MMKSTALSENFTSLIQRVAHALVRKRWVLQQPLLFSEYQSSPPAPENVVFRAVLRGCFSNVCNSRHDQPSSAAFYVLAGPFALGEISYSS
jgi:hypothetical protein